MTALDTLHAELEHAAPHTILERAAALYGERLAVVTSFQPTGIIILHMLSTIAPRTPVLTVDTGLLFAETYRLIDEIAARFDLNLTRLRPVQPALDSQGVPLWQTNPDLCCQLRKVEPLRAALAPFDAWIAGLRRDQSATRATTPVIAWDARHEMVKFCPLATWTETMVWTYIHAHNLPYNRLHDQGYASIGCQPCTRPLQPGESLRAGRWSGLDKTECGLHVSDESEQTE
jgi:phosphoadenosine phosphosulfate reductase